MLELFCVHPSLQVKDARISQFQFHNLDSYVSSGNQVHYYPLLEMND
jgi:hypothetical protein